jgi:hypothetical protein
MHVAISATLCMVSSAVYDMRTHDNTVVPCTELSEEVRTYIYVIKTAALGVAATAHIVTH